MTPKHLPPINVQMLLYYTFFARQMQMIYVTFPKLLKISQILHPFREISPLQGF